MIEAMDFPHAPASVTAARRFAGRVLEAAPAEARDAALLMVSELAANCIRHSEGGFALRITQTADEIRVEATDQGGGAPRMRTPGPKEPDGRGLQIIDMFARAWGFAVTPGRGKTVWFTLPVHAVGGRDPAAA